MIRHSLGGSVQPKHIAATGTVLLRLGWVAFILGCLGAGFVLLHAPTQPRPAATGPVISPPEPAIVAARRIIPKIVAGVYMALDHGAPSAVSAVLSPNVRNNFQILDAICRPYTYRAHYIENIIERPDNHFEAWVRVLFKPLDERAYVLTFQHQRGLFVLDGIAEPPPNWFQEDEDRAIELSRQFVFAAKAGNQDVLSRLVTADMPIATFVTEECWRNFFEDVGEPTLDSVKLTSYKGQKIKVAMRMDLPGVLGYHTGGYGTGYFTFERIASTFKIVAVDPIGSTLLMPLRDACPSGTPKVVEDPNLEARTLKRFHLDTPLAEGQ
jgi:hypothetical protein